MFILISAIIGSIISLFMIVFLLLKFRNKRAKVLLICFYLCMLVWSVFRYSYLNAPDAETANNWSGFGGIWILPLTLLFYIVFYFTNSRWFKSNVLLVVLFAGAFALMGIYLFTDWMFDVAVLGPHGWEAELTTTNPFLLSFVMLYASTYSFLAFILSVLYYRKTSGFRRKQARYLVVGYSMPLLAGIIEQVVLTYILGLDVPKFMYFGLFIGTLVVMYGVWKYQLFVISSKVVATDIVKSMLEALVIVDRDGVIVECNDAAMRIFRKDQREIVGKKDKNIVKIKELKKLKNRLEKEGNIYNYETNLKFGKAKLPVLLSMSSVEDRFKEHQGYIYIINDVQELVAARNLAVENALKLKTEKDRIDAIVQNIDDGVIVVDKNTNITLFNQTADEMTGLRFDQALGKNIEKTICLKREEQNKCDYSFLKTAISRKKHMNDNYYYDLTRPDKTSITVKATAVPLTDKNNKAAGAVIVLRDVTKERQIDKAKTEFVSLASHQLKTPLTGVNWYTEMLLKGDVGKISKEQAECVKEIEKGNKRMVDLVSALLNVSRIELGTLAVDPKPTNLEEVSESVIKELEPTIKKKKMKVKAKYDKLPKISVDPNLTRILFQNLYSNAVKYTPEQGKVEMELKKQGKYIQLIVKDNGIGIPKDEQSKMFTKLNRASNAKSSGTEGTGLGLYLVKSIVDQTKGKVTFTSEENKGTTFTVEIPTTGMRKRTGSKRLEEVK